MLTVKHILVPTDFSPPSAVAFAYGRELANRFGSTLHVLHVAQSDSPYSFVPSKRGSEDGDRWVNTEDDAWRQLEALVLDPDDTAPATATAVVSATSPGLAIVDYAKAHRVDAIVMGTHGRTGAARLVMGSVAELVVRLAPCPVLAVKSPEPSFAGPPEAASTVLA